MNRMSVVALNVFLLGLIFLTLSSASGEEVNILGLRVHSQIFRGLGVISMIFSVITFVASYSGMLAPPREKPKR